MTPGGMLNSPTQPSGSSSAYNSISSAAMPTDPSMDDSQKPTENPVDTLLKRFEVAINSFRDLTAVPDYAGATDEANAVKKAMNNWLSAVADKLPSSSAQSGGGESQQTSSAGSTQPY